MKKRRSISFIVVGLSLVLFTSAVSAIVVVDGTTYQMWTFDDADNSAAPEISDNPYGTATADITLNGDSCGSPPGWYDSFLGHQGVWASEETSVTLTIPNSQILNPYKDIWLEMVFRANLDLTDAKVIATVPTATEIVQLGWEITSVAGPFNWHKLVVGWRIYPNPSCETIYLYIHDSGADIDYIEVSTACVPEPATLAILGIGVLMLIRRRK